MIQSDGGEKQGWATILDIFSRFFFFFFFPFFVAGGFLQKKFWVIKGKIRDKQEEKEGKRSGQSLCVTKIKMFVSSDNIYIYSDRLVFHECFFSSYDALLFLCCSFTPVHGIVVSISD